MKINLIWSLAIIFFCLRIRLDLGVDTACFILKNVGLWALTVIESRLLAQAFSGAKYPD